MLPEPFPDLSVIVRPEVVQDRIGTGGIKLTGAVYLPLAYVEAAVAELGLGKEWIGKGNREVQTVPVLHPCSARSAGLPVTAPNSPGGWLTTLPGTPGHCSAGSAATATTGMVSDWDDRRRKAFWTPPDHTGRVRGAGHRGIKAGRMLTEALAEPPRARNQAAPTCPICAAGKPAADGKIWQSARNQPSVA